MSFGRGPMDRTQSGSTENVLRKGADGQNSVRKQVKCSSEGGRWTELGQEARKMSFGRAPKDKT
ncbi:hypothetical protein [Bacillus sp. X1(2014)]|uniref:hypothetical protein n=1 Tax=Bacillus sp. X1(2014) TaxID=1565991 RepID=UPI0011A1A2B2|nr:hypothetical protein [Bacillus sp. X1(2014)]